MLKKFNLKLAIHLIGIIILSWILINLKWHDLYLVIISLKIQYIFYYCFISILSNLLRVIRLKNSLKYCNYNISRKDSYSLTIKSLFFGFVTPARIGSDISRISSLKELGISPSESTINILIERLFDFAIMFLLGFTGIVYIYWTNQNLRFTLFFLSISISCIILFVNYYKGLGLIIKKMITYFFKSKLIKKDRVGNLNKLAVIWRRVSMFHLMFSILICLSNLSQIYFLSMSFGFNSNHLWIIFTYVAASIISLLPISFNGLGTREGIYILLMNKIGISSDAAVAFSLIDSIVFVFVILLLMMTPIWIFKN